MTKINDNDLELLSKKGIALEKVLNQIETFKEGIPFVNLKRAAVVADGILKFTEEEEAKLEQKFTTTSAAKSLLKFVPASGAASRMFKSLFNFLETFDPSKENLEDYLKRTNDTAITTFFEGQKQLPFYDLVQDRIAGKVGSDAEASYLFVKEMLLEDGLNYGFYPKGLLPFHKYGKRSVTPFEEHLIEGSRYATSSGKARLHFTISEQHAVLFEEEYNSVNESVSNATETTFEVDYSFQKSATDTVAVAMDNTPFRNSDGSLLFRPGGHGALIENLNDQDADVIFIKNIDNEISTMLWYQNPLQYWRRVKKSWQDYF